ncbi:S1C family serine protease [Pseudonocardia sp. CA-107938]|uniref:S1C family serine protease n=1 Tax=Pseudonocardia sp. CA-107938 TaxID=3240021 RepID=UPI003D901FDE
MSDEQREADRGAGIPADGSRNVSEVGSERSTTQHAMVGAQQHQTHSGSPTQGSPWAPPQNPGPAAPPAAGPAWSPAGPPSNGHGAGYPTAQLPPPFGQDPGQAQHQQPPRKRGLGTVITAAVLAGVVGGAAGFGGAYALVGNHGSAVGLTQQPASSNSANLVPGSVGAAAAKAMPSTVDIQVRLAQGVGEGSGVILTPDGNVLTNNHVVAGSTGQIVVTLADGSEHQAKVVGTSPSYDLAVIKIADAQNLTPATLGQSSSLQVGQPVVAIGSPQGLTGTVTTGIISAFNRTVATQGENGGPSVVYNGLQTDAPINHGNSGGPLVNLDGQVIGINSAIAGDNSTGLGFAIPVDQAKRVADEIMQSGTATKPLLGVQGNTAPASPAVASPGARLDVVQPGSPAAAAGIVAGDVVTKVGDTKVEDFTDLVARIGSYAPGAQVPLTVTSGGQTKTVTVTLGSQPDRAATTANGGQLPGGTGNPFGQGGPFGGGGN